MLCLWVIKIKGGYTIDRETYENVLQMKLFTGALMMMVRINVTGDSNIGANILVYEVSIFPSTRKFSIGRLHVKYFDIIVTSV
jgi:hypothetical protein